MLIELLHWILTLIKIAWMSLITLATFLVRVLATVMETWPDRLRWELGRFHREVVLGQWLASCEEQPASAWWYLPLLLFELALAGAAAIGGGATIVSLVWALLDWLFR